MTNRENPVQLRPEVAWFAQQMEIKLRENDHKGDWIACGCEYLQRRMRAEALELEQAIVDAGSPPWGQDEPHRVAIVREAADVANFAMMLADNWRGCSIESAVESIGEVQTASAMQSRCTGCGENCSQPQKVKCCLDCTCKPQSRDESKDIAIWHGLNVGDGRRLNGGPFTIWNWADRKGDPEDWERYVPYAQLESCRRDSELLDAICEAYDAKDIFPGPLADSIKRAIVERAKR